MGKTLMIGSCEPFSGKSALVLGIAKYLKDSGKDVRFGKPLATSCELREVDSSFVSAPFIDDDVRFVGSILELQEEQLIPSVHLIEPQSAEKRLLGAFLDSGQAFQKIQEKLNADFNGLNILEAAGSLHEGLLYGLSLVQVAKSLNAKVLLAHYWENSTSVDALLAAKEQLGENLAGIVLNAVSPDDLEFIQSQILPALGSLGLDVFGVMPRSPLLRSVTVEELVRRLEAQVICCDDRLELMVETLTIGAMNVNSAMEVFRKRRNMAVVTGADRTDIQLAALEASTQCLILTGASKPLPQLINRAEELEVPLLTVESDTLSTVEVIEQAFGHVRLHEDVKANYAFSLVHQYCDLKRLITKLGISF